MKVVTELKELDNVSQTHKLSEIIENAECISELVDYHHVFIKEGEPFVATRVEEGGEITFHNCPLPECCKVLKELRTELETEPGPKKEKRIAGLLFGRRRQHAMPPQKESQTKYQYLIKDIKKKEPIGDKEILEFVKQGGTFVDLQP